MIINKEGKPTYTEDDDCMIPMTIRINNLVVSKHLVDRRLSQSHFYKIVHEDKSVVDYFEKHDDIKGNKIKEEIVFDNDKVDVNIHMGMRGR